MKKILLFAATLSLSFVAPIKAQDKEFYDQSTYQTVLEPGMYKVGSTLDAGIYRIISDAEYGMYVISSDANQEDIIDFSAITTHSYFEIVDDQYLKLDGTFAVPMDEVDPIFIEDNTIGPGTYFVGYDIPAGEYEVIQDEETAMYVIYDSLDKSEIASMSAITNNAFVEVEDGQYLQLYGAIITDDALVNEERPDESINSNSN